jgi:hypothetical protein
VVPIAAAIGLVSAVVALAVVRARHETPREELAVAAPRPVAQPPRPAALALSELVVVVSPPGAKITIDGLPVEGNPYTGRFRRDRIHEVGATAVGYEPKTQGVVLAKDLVVTLNLDKKKTVLPPPHGLASRRAAEPKRSTRAAPSSDRDPVAEIAGERVAAPSSSPSLAPIPAAVSPAGGRAPIHPIQTKSPYETP